MLSAGDKLSRWDPSEDEDETYSETHHKQPRTKRRKANTGKAITPGHRVTRASASLSGLLDVFQYGMQIHASLADTTDGDSDSFESTIEGLLPEYLEARHTAWAQTSDIGDSGKVIRALSRYETTAILNYANQRSHASSSVAEAIVRRKLQLQREKRSARTPEPPVRIVSNTLTAFDPPPPACLPPAVLESLRAIQTTRYENSFASRVYGHKPLKIPGLLATDWETCSPWTNLMDDIHAHYSHAHPGRDQTERPLTPITYVSLQPSHLRQVHDLLARVFWDGIDVSDSLQYSPERCTVIATYGHLVVGAAFLSSPQETYITYLAVRAGWDNSQIATTMLYHLISLNPHRDITLHVSANNPAMLLYNRFGFKAEEFIAGFYEDYLDSHSRASMNAFRLRLRR
ncbi:hypothetical protein HYDPIDRAFT_27934 [Hydnomerulius pinastri MD-312]|uniref:N-acetyltransferase domain-containing protein n=1 Tax=Hydnomerulius pinastri MD-312 TaxID=994086 RepID=A0A0C9VHU0_9AGAM|nr:hypothetical protein HYDPIDRAFT_27934 [Hydnomerulius pinastri MD-312]